MTSPADAAVAIVLIALGMAPGRLDGRSSAPDNGATDRALVPRGDCARRRRGPSERHAHRHRALRTVHLPRCPRAFQVLSSLPGAEVAFVAAKAGPVTDESGFLEVRAHASSTSCQT